MRKTSVLVLLPVLALLAAACGSSSKKSTTSAPAPASSTPSSSSSSTSSSSPPAAAATEIKTATVAGLGPILVDAQGKTLYIFAPDKAKAVTCKGGCAAIWPPVKLSGSKAKAGGAVKASLLSSDPNPGGGSVVTYAGWPLYAYIADQGPGSANGQAKNITGGLWYVISPTGHVITKAP